MIATFVKALQATAVTVVGLTELSTTCPVPEEIEKVVATPAPPVPIDNTPQVNTQVDCNKSVTALPPPPPPPTVICVRVDTQFLAIALVQSTGRPSRADSRSLSESVISSLVLQEDIYRISN